MYWFCEFTSFCSWVTSDIYLQVLGGGVGKMISNLT